MSQPLFITLFCTLTLLIGTGIFFYWRYAYGVWATNRQARTREAHDDPSTVILDPSWTSSKPLSPTPPSAFTPPASPLPNSPPPAPPLPSAPKGPP